MRRTLTRDVLRAGVSELDEINVAKEAFARAEEQRGYRQIQLIDESGAKILLNGGDASDLFLHSRLPGKRRHRRARPTNRQPRKPEDR
jgi:hypothetical protein